ncbi:hypothetical protein GCM10010172_81860 [Paractinoplanes ferrugineus]|uniref:Pyridoxamine 5'-phosphate oxidase N-terminal domain-containing protein n=2 Tax=Paractinoplanes ferrugineus TaxID=113564 RepID=A0A919IZ80_9ACTN|nr:hypothetical protein Afe05nite_23470 [Actinoplanes ferrugineus]
MNRLTSASGVQAVIGHPLPMIKLKEIDALDAGCRAVLRRSPIAAFGYRDAAGTARSTFVGGEPGFVRVHSPTRISFPGISFSGVPLPGISGPRLPPGPVSFFFLLPGVGEVLRVNGSATGRPDHRIDIQQAYVHCAQAVLRSRLWQPPASGPASSGPAVSGSVAPVGARAGGGPLSRPGIAEFLAAAPFLALSSWDAAGGGDTSPRGDRQPVARILDGRTLVLPDRKGNRRADTLHNLLADDRLALAALVPGRDEVLHVRGHGRITDDPDLLATMALRERPPHLALLIDVEDAEITGSDAVARARIWSPASHLDRATAPDLMAVAGEHLAANSTGAGRRAPALALRVLGAIPGTTRLLRLGMNRAYRAGLRREGYDDVRPG